MRQQHGFRFLLTKPCIRHAIVQYRRDFSSEAADSPILRIPSASVYHYSASKPALNLNWTVNQGETWAILGHAAEEKSTLLETLKGQTRISPFPPKGIWPFLFEEGLDPVHHIRTVSFAHRPRVAGGGSFYDFSARYGAVREDDTITLRESLLEKTENQHDLEETLVFLAGALELKEFLDLPFVTLSNGQTRRARIIRALLQNPRVLLLDEPLTGLDKHHRPRLMSLLHNLHKNHAPHIIFSLRMQDPIPEWVTHIALVQPNGSVITRERSAILTSVEKGNTRFRNPTVLMKKHINNSQQATLVDLKCVNVAYQTRHVLKDVTWTIREGERWILQGANGSGKTTLLSMITGEHPQSFSQQNLYLFGIPRRRLATAAIARRIGVCSPELYNAFPRRSGPTGLTVRDVITSGFEGIFTYRNPTSEQAQRVDSLLAELGPTAWSKNAGPSETTEFGKRIFADLTPGEQSLVLLLRAIANEPPLLILDEAFSGMDSQMTEVTRKYLRERFGDKQTIIWVSHWDSEAPWGAEDGVKKYSLENGLGTQSY